MRSASSAVALALLLAAAAQAGERAGSVRLLLQESPLAGYRHAAAEDLWPLIRVGDALELSREPDNPHDANAVRIDWRGRKIGYVPRRENAELARGLDQGAPLRARIVRLERHPNPARRIRFEVYID